MFQFVKVGPCGGISALTRRGRDMRALSLSVLVPVGRTVRMGICEAGSGLHQGLDLLAP